jgi:hypothetical protein
MPRQDYDERVAARQERLENAAERAEANAAAYFKKADLSEEATGIPFGQPILVGHHSEGRHRAVLKRADSAMRNAVAESKKADYYAGAAASVGTAGVSSDDPNGVAKLTEKVAELEARQAKMKAANDAWRKAGNKAGRNAAGEWIEPPYPSYSLSNNSAVIRSTKARIEQLKRAAQVETKTIETNVGVTVIENAEANRVQIIFPGKPDEATRTMLKSYGFKWAPSEGAWQRLLNNAARWAAQQVVAKLTPA